MKKSKNLVKKLLVMAMTVMMGISSMPMGVLAEGESISLPSSETVTVGSSITITPSNLVKGGGKTGYRWTSSDGGNVSLEKSGDGVKVTGGAVGNVKIIGYVLKDSSTWSGSGEPSSDDILATSNECTVEVKAAAPTPTPKSIALYPNPVTTGGTIMATLTGYEEPGPGLSWKSNDENVVKLASATTGGSRTSQPNTVIVVGTGSTTITVKDEVNNVSATCDVNISGIPATGIALNKTSGTINLSSGSSTETLEATLTPSNSTSTIIWTSSNPSVATVSPASQAPTSGKGSTVVTALKPGTSTITATADGHTATYALTVIKPVTGISIEPATDQTVMVGNSITLKAKISPADGSPVTYKWTVSDGSGTYVTYAGDGTDTLTITGKSVTSSPVTVSVKETNANVSSSAVKVNVVAAVPITNIALNPAVVKVTKGFTVTVNSTITPDNASTKAGLKWDFTGNDNGYVSKSDEAPTSVKIKGEKVKTDAGLALIQKISASDNQGSPVEKSVDVRVYDVPTMAYGDNNKLVIGKMPESIYTGNNNVDSVSRGKIAIYYDGSCLYTTDSSSNYGSTSDTKSLSASDIQELIKKDDVYNKLKNLDKDSVTLQFRVYGSDGSTTNTDTYGSADVNVYKLTVTGTGINTDKYYAVKGTEIKLTATPSSGYTFSKWEDGTTTNPRTVTVSGSGTYKATAVQSTAAGANGAAGAAGGSTGRGGNSNLDKVPKTGEGRDVFIMWMILIISCIVAGVLMIVQYSQKMAIMKAAGTVNGKNSTAVNKTTGISPVNDKKN